MIELLDNLAQLMVVLGGCFLSGLLYLRSRRLPYFLLCCFYGCFALALLYWTLYLLLFGETPNLFYVSEIIWIAGCVLLVLLQLTLPELPPRTFRCRSAFLAPPIGALLLLVYILRGDVFAGMLRCLVMTALAWNSLRALACRRRSCTAQSRSRRFHCLVLVFVLLENGLWLSSVPWLGDTLANPYFWIDVALTACLFALLPAVRKVVDA